MGGEEQPHGLVVAVHARGIENFDLAGTLDCKELDNLPRPPTGTVRVVRRPMGPLPPNSARPVP